MTRGRCSDDCSGRLHRFVDALSTLISKSMEDTLATIHAFDKVR
jgi:hypothetical protein